MQFVQFGMLGALAALAIPVIIHLLFRNKPRVVQLGTLQFLHAVLRENARRRRLKRYLLLALRLACVAAMALLFARPYLLATEPGVGDRLVVILVDRSASMGLKGKPRPLDKAIEGARAVLARMGPKAIVEAATFDRAIHPFKEAADLGKSNVTPTASGTDYSAALAWARDLCARSRRPSKEVHIFTDLQRSGLDRGETVTMPPGVDVRLVDLGRAFPKNVAVTAVAASPEAARPGTPVTVSAAVLNASPMPLEAVPVRLHLESEGAARDLEKAVDLDGGATATVAFELGEMPEGVWRGHVEVAAEGDELTFDDRRFLAVAVAPPAPIVLLDGDPGRTEFAAETYFLQAALRLAPPGETFEKSPFDPKTVDASDGGAVPTDLEGVGAIVLANVGALTPDDARRLAGFVEHGGGLVVFTGDRFGPEAARALDDTGLGVGAVVGPAPATDLPYRLERWEPDHPVFKPFANPEHGDLRRPSFLTITRIKPRPPARVLATFRGGDPALVEKAYGKGKVLWFASSCDRDWGDWPRGRLYLPLVHQLAAYASGLSEGGRVRQVAAVDGVEPGVAESGRVVRVVNGDPFESDTARCTPAEFAGRYGFHLPGPSLGVASDKVEQKSPGKTPDERLRSDEIWPWFAATLLGLLLLEGFLANRTAA